MREFFEWASATALGSGIRNSQYLFPGVEIVHLGALAVLLGSVMIVNLRVFGWAMRRQSVAEVAEDFAPFTWWSFAVMAASGVLLFAAKAEEIYAGDLPGFLWKMGLIGVGVVLRLLRPSRVVAAVSSVVWLSAACAGLSIEFL